MSNRVDEYMAKQKSPQKEICQKLRKFILKTLPGAKEEMRWGTPVFDGGKFYIGALKDHVNFGFAVSGLTKKEASFFEGSGKTMKHVKVRSLKDIDEKKLAKLLRMVHKKAECEGC